MYTSYSAPSYSSESIKSFKKSSQTGNSKPKSHTSSATYNNIRKSSTKTSSPSSNSEPNKKGNVWIAVLGIFLFILPLIICGIGAFVDYGGFNSDPNAIKVGVSSEELKGERYEDVVKIFEKNGFTNIVVREGDWDLFHKSGTVKSISIDGKEEFRPYTKLPKDALIVIVYYK